MPTFRRIFGRRPVHRTRVAIVAALLAICVAVPGIWLLASRDTRPTATRPPTTPPTQASQATTPPPSTAGALPPAAAPAATTAPKAAAATATTPTPPATSAAPAPPAPAVAAPPPPPGVPRTEILWEDEAKLLAGPHPLSWQRLVKIKGNRSGRVEIVDDAGVWRISGRQEGATVETAGDSITIDGVILSVTEGTVVMRGEIVFRRAKVNGGQPCRTAGDLRFYRRRVDPFWRLEGDQNPCNGEREIVDIRLRPEQVPSRPVRKPTAKPTTQ